ncbi:hypothetical protein C5167_043604 [Papaver somniferum]|uniref:Mitochondrial thiamine pyrophosphate carrier n=1 Tax=Papaver somniferum TaxID=3469 RepID=A0A4Y7LA34_PAPSO|nr:mitochondrial thiamine diphosphate carrier 2-like [Papaver somniferum]XP_026421598.1 mitochondrial thiamine diphosphate carrier 2-like [Papaver somniferum]RZC81035.1 hypothetical protein C5167_043604 [Papaver somniferum]
MEESRPFNRALIAAAAGAISGGISRTVTSPLDVIKIRFQVQLEPTSSWELLRKGVHESSKYTGMMQATKAILGEEGLPGFWRGNVPGLLMVMPYTSIQFMVLHKIKTFFSGSSKAEDHVHLRPHLSYVSGALAGCAATVGSYPFDLLRTILASQGEPKVYTTMRSAFVDIVRSRGFRGLYPGLTPALLEIIPYAGVQFGTYDTFKRWTMRLNRPQSLDRGSNLTSESLSSFQLFVCGLASSTCARAVCHPLDVVKKRFQIVGLHRDIKYGSRVEQHAYNGMCNALRCILVTEGWAGLYKGIIPSVIKAAPAGAVTFAAYEYTSEWLESHSSRNGA